MCIAHISHTVIELSNYCMKCLLKNVAFDRIYNFEFSLSFELMGVTLPHVQLTLLFKIRLSFSITISVKRDVDKPQRELH